MQIADRREWTNIGKYDVVVVGGGIAGVSAAVAAGRLGKKVLLLEKSIFLGGLATNGLISWFEPLCDGCGNQMIWGIGQELMELATKYGFDSLPKEWKERNGTANERTGRYASFFSPTIFAMALDEFVRESGGNILFDCLVTYPVMEDNHCSGLVFETIEGKNFVEAGVIIDATGTACILEKAGIPVEAGLNYLNYTVHEIRKEDLERYKEQGKDIGKLRKWKSIGGDYTGKGQPKEVSPISGLTGKEVTEFVLLGRKMMFDCIKKEEKDCRDIMMLPGIPQFRTIRHLKGAAVFRGQKQAADFIGKCGDFRKRGCQYEIPYGALYHEAFDNILAAGRIISVDKEGWEISRVIPVCALTGQAAGVAASLAIEKKAAVKDVSAHEIREML